MLFHSFTYLFAFLPLVVIGFWLIARTGARRTAHVWLLVVSLVFYAYAKPSNLPLLIGSIVLNWQIAHWIGRAQQPRRRKTLLQAGLVANILFLCAFKYANFILRSLPVAFHMALPDWSLPLGISFFTLTQIMFLVDTYQGLNEPPSLLSYASLVSLFPYVTSGPLVRGRAIMPQLEKLTDRTDRIDQICRGLHLFAIGLGKKVILADSFSTIADTGFQSIHTLSTVEAWIVTLAYSFQIYFDFSGYSDMAVGSARMLGLEIPQNFNAPYRSKSISEFWQRWHISLSNFITNYLFTPLLRAMGRATLGRSVIATMLAMGIAGLWHGPAWTFVMFGLLHGAALATNQVWKKKKLGKVPDWLGVLLTFAFVNVAFVFFRSPSLGAAMAMLGQMLPHGHALGLATLQGVLPVGPALVIQPAFWGVILAFLLPSSAERDAHFRPTPLNAAAAAALVLASIFLVNSITVKQFVYFAF